MDASAGGEQPDIFDKWLAFRAAQAEDAAARAPIVPAEEPTAPATPPVAADAAAVEGISAPPAAAPPSHPAPRHALPRRTPPAPSTTPAGPSHPAAPSSPPPLEVTFKPRNGGRLVIAAALLCAVAAAATATVHAWRDPSTSGWSIAGTLWALTAIIWAVHSGTSVTRMSVRGGMLHVRWRGTRLMFDLTSPLTAVDVIGKPGRHGWQVRILRMEFTPFVIDSSMVDPHEFMRVLRYYRPEV